jgi:hypothetical protein
MSVILMVCAKILRVMMGPMQASRCGGDKGVQTQLGGVLIVWQMCVMEQRYFQLPVVERLLGHR